MALTRKFLAALGIEADKVDEIINAHSETVDALKEQLKTAKEDAEKLKDTQKKLDDLKADVKNNYKSKSDFDKLDKEFKDYKTEVTSKEAAAAKEKAVRAYFEGKGIKGANLEIAIRGSKDEVAAIELDGDKIKNPKALDDLVSGTFKGLVSVTGQKGAGTNNPPANGGSGDTKKTRDEILAIKDGPSRRKAMAEHPELFGLAKDE